MDGIDLGKVIGSTLAAVLLLLIIFLGKWLWDIGKKAGEKGLEVGKQVIDQAKDRMDGIPDGGGRYDDLYATAYEEMKSANMLRIMGKGIRACVWRPRQSKSPIRQVSC